MGLVEGKVKECCFDTIFAAIEELFFYEDAMGDVKRYFQLF